MTTATKQEIPEEYKRVLRLIPQGSEKPITVSELEKLTGIGSTRVRHIVSQSIIQHGILIGTSNRIKNSGYFYAITQEEREETRRNMLSRANYMLKRAKVFENAPPVDQMDFDFLD